ncbi:putative acyl-CoA dehydrogenase [Gorgonomyces haynaldii]|nr:putative acyl-CoA dehydrogenase [Gorgonomyces haynaldii]
MNTQQKPQILDPFSTNKELQTLLESYLKSDYVKAKPELLSLSSDLLSQKTLEALGDAERNPPTVEHYDTFGNRVDALHTSHGWKHMKQLASVHGLIGTAYEPEFGHLARMVQFAKLMLFCPFSAMVSCPLAMTDGCCRVLKDLKRPEYKHLQSRDPNNSWTSGQWMTERLGGSDLSHTESVAQLHQDQWRITGFKWFSSATDSDVSLALAKTPSGLSLFLINLKQDKKHIRIERLKKKHGTTPLPTAELTLDNVPGILLGKEGEGVKAISPMLNLTRLHNAISAVGYLTQAYNVVQSYAKVRWIGKRLLQDFPLHQRIMARINNVRIGLMHLTFYCVNLLGKQEHNIASEDEQLLLRVLTPLVKVYTAKLGYQYIVECAEALGGMGYIENADPELNVSRMVRDALVLCIWEGTTNVLAADFWRCLTGKARQVIHSHLGVQIKRPEQQLMAESLFDIGNEITFQILLSKDKQLAQEWIQMKPRL